MYNITSPIAPKPRSQPSHDLSFLEMSETISRALRDGALDGELAPALTIADSLQIPLGPPVFDHFLHSLASNISAGKSQSLGLVLVALDRSPAFYLGLFRRWGIDLSAANKWLRILDCYSDPLGWAVQLPATENCSGLSQEDDKVVLFRDVKDANKLFNAVLDLGKGVASQSKVRFSVAIDSASTLLRHASLLSVSGFISNLRSHDQVSCMLWLIHSDLHEQKTIAAFEYMSSMVSSLEPTIQASEVQCGKFNVRLKRRNGRVKMTAEEFHIHQAEIKFAPVSSGNVVMINQTLLPKVQFNLQLSEKELLDRAKVILPFEHQDDRKTTHIYDGRQSLVESQLDPHAVKPMPSTREPTTDPSSGGRGEIHYIRDSDDERPDSDEDPDDDLDI